MPFLRRLQRDNNNRIPDLALATIVGTLANSAQKLSPSWGWYVNFRRLWYRWRAGPQHAQRIVTSRGCTGSIQAGARSSAFHTPFSVTEREQNNGPRRKSDYSDEQHPRMAHCDMQLRCHRKCIAPSANKAPLCAFRQFEGAPPVPAIPHPSFLRHPSLSYPQRCHRANYAPGSSWTAELGRAVHTNGEGFTSVTA